MTATDPTNDRDVVPRWRTFGATAQSRETESYQRSLGSLGPADLGEQELNFRTHPGPAAAADLVGAALVAGARTDLSLRAAQLLADNQDDVALVELGRSHIDGEGTPQSEFALEERHELVDVERTQRRAHRLREVLKREPRNAIRWTDLALAHTVLGVTDAAEQEMRVALALAGDNRFVLRAAASLYVHLGRPDQAHKVVARDRGLLVDPWLAAAEIATAQVAGLTPIALKRGTSLLRDTAGLSPWHVSELASELAMVEARAGHSRPARRLMELALREPTDNAAAQAEWAKIHGLITVAEPLDLDLPRTFEARSRRAAAEGDWNASVHSGLQWISDQPFAIEAARFTSYVAAVGAEDYGHSEQAARAGLVANGGDPLLRNNLVFALANQDKVDEAVREFDLIDAARLDRHELSVVTATEGFLRFRSGRPEEGRALYRLAVESALRAKRPDVVRLAGIYWAREELLSGESPESDAALRQALEVAGGSDDEVARLWFQRLLDLARRQHRSADA